MKSTNQKAIVHGSGLLEGKREKRKGDKKEKNKRGGKKKEHKALMKLKCLSSPCEKLLLSVSTTCETL